MNTIHLICGKICTGKSRYARRLARQENAVILSCDELMAGLFPEGLGARYDEMSPRVKAYLHRKAAEIALAGPDVVLDWGFWSRAERAEVAAYYRAQGLRTVWYYVDIADEDWRESIRLRNERVRIGEAEDVLVDDGLLRKLEAAFEPPCRAEMDVWLLARGEMILEERVALVLERVRALYRDVLGDSLTGVYVHGSLALGGFVWERSDIDFLAVVRRAPTYEEKAALMQGLVALHRSANPRGLEMSVVLESVCQNPTFPTPFELHFSSGTLDWYEREPERYCREMRGEDGDLGAYMAIIQQSGLVLTGAPIARVFGELPQGLYRSSVLHDLADAREDFESDFAYHTLNLCRTLAYLRDGASAPSGRAANGGWRICPESTLA